MYQSKSKQEMMTQTGIFKEYFKKSQSTQVLQEWLKKAAEASAVPLA